MVNEIEATEPERTEINSAFIIAIVGLVLKYGVPAAIKVIRDWNITNPTLADIELLRGRVKKPEEFFDVPPT